MVIETTASDQTAYFERTGADVDLSGRVRLSASLRVATVGGAQPIGAPAALGFRRADGMGQTLFVRAGRMYLGRADGGEGPGADLDTSVLRTYTLELERTGANPGVLVRASGGIQLRAPLFQAVAAEASVFFGSVAHAPGAVEWRSVSDTVTGLPFTYQGRLNHPRGQPANGTYDFQFQLWDAYEGGGQMGNTLTVRSVRVAGGMFSVDLNFGAGVLVEDELWMGLSVRSASAGGDYTALQPRVPVRPVPTAIQADRAASLAPGVAVRSVNGLTDAITFQAGEGLALHVDPVLSTVRLGLSPAGGGPVPEHAHFGQSWSGSSTWGLSLANSAGEGVGLLANAAGAMGTGVRGFGGRAGVEGVGTMTGVFANSSAGSGLFAITETGVGVEINARDGDFIRGFQRFNGHTFRVSAPGDVFATSFNGRFVGDASGITSVPASAITGIIPRERLPADLGAGGGPPAPHDHFGELWMKGGALALSLTNTNRDESSVTLGLGALGGTALVVRSLGNGVEVTTDSGLPLLVDSHGDEPAVLAIANAGAGIRAVSEAGAGLDVASRTGDLLVGRGGETRDIRVRIANDGAISARSFEGDGSGLVNLGWMQLTGQVPEFKIPDAIARTNHTHAGDAWSGLGRVLTLSTFGVDPNVPALETFAGSGIGTKATTYDGVGVLGVSDRGVGVRGEGGVDGVGVIGRSQTGAGVRAFSESGIGLSATSTSGIAASFRGTGGTIVEGLRSLPSGDDERVFEVTAEGHVIASGAITATAFNTTSDRNAKTGFQAVDPQDILRKVASLAITRWAFTNSTEVPHIGPVAQDFHEAFGLGADDRHIATVDADGVALAAIQGLNARLETELRAKDRELDAMRAEMAEIRALLGQTLRNSR
jgi:hypothetical protein